MLVLRATRERWVKLCDTRSPPSTTHTPLSDFAELTLRLLANAVLMYLRSLATQTLPPFPWIDAREQGLYRAQKVHDPGYLTAAQVH